MQVPALQLGTLYKPLEPAVHCYISFNLLNETNILNIKSHAKVIVIHYSFLALRTVLSTNYWGKKEGKSTAAELPLNYNSFEAEDGCAVSFKCHFQKKIMDEKNLLWLYGRSQMCVVLRISFRKKKKFGKTVWNEPSVFEI